MDGVTSEMRLSQQDKCCVTPGGAWNSHSQRSEVKDVARSRGGAMGVRV